ncbi:MAG: spore germination protein [Ruminococcaceae bacterium]|nr:spore germination protein [Oscillospiraceae bacterium]
MVLSEFCGEYTADVALVDRELRIGESFDLKKRELIMGGKQVCLYYVDGFVKDHILQKLLEVMMNVKKMPDSPQTLIAREMPYIEAALYTDTERLVKEVLSGVSVFIIDGMKEAVAVNSRTYPARSVSEPENDKVLRGSRDGFVETLLFNTAIIRRRIRDPQLTVKVKTVGRSSKTDVAVCYMDDRVDRKLLNSVLKKLDAIDVYALSMGHESLAECLIEKKWYNPFPKIRYTERPDAATAMILEGSIILLCDSSPEAMMLPTSIFDFLQETGDYYYPPLTGSYLRLLRVAVFLLTIFLSPLWFLLIEHPEWLPQWLHFLDVDKEGALPILFQLLLVEFVVDGLKMASLNTPNTLNNSLSVVGGLILGDFAVQTGWLVPEVILYMGFVSIANFTQPSYELGYALKFMRMILLVLTALFDVTGFVAGTLLTLVLIASNKSVDGGRRYLYPLIPFNGRALKRLFLRVKLDCKKKEGKEGGKSK